MICRNKNTGPLTHRTHSLVRADLCGEYEPKCGIYKNMTIRDDSCPPAACCVAREPLKTFWAPLMLRCLSFVFVMTSTTFPTLLDNLENGGKLATPEEEDVVKRYIRNFRDNFEYPVHNRCSESGTMHFAPPL